MSAEFFVILILMVLSAFISAVETAFNDINNLKLHSLANEGDKRALVTQELIDDPHQSLQTTIFICDNLLNTFIAILSADYLYSEFNKLPVIVIALIITAIVIFVCEVIPKALIQNRSFSFSLAVTPFLRFLTVLFKPFCLLFDALYSLRKSNSPQEEDDDVGADELVAMVEEAQEDGEIAENEADLITNAIEFNEMEVGDILTPRVDIVAIDCEEEDMDKIEMLYRDSGYSRLPLYKENIDNIVGILHEKEFNYLYYSRSSVSLQQIAQKPIFTSSYTKISVLLKELQKQKSHMAVVVDEYGGTEGIITMEDILEELVGEIYDEHDEVVEYYEKISDDEYLVKADIDIEDFFAHFKIRVKEEYDFNTTSAWVTYNLNKIPSVGDCFSFQGMEVTVIRLENKIVDSIKVKLNRESH